MEVLYDLAAQYGPAGLISGILVYAVIALRRRVDQITDEIIASERERNDRIIEAERAHNEDFTSLLKQNVEVVAVLTGYIKALKESVDRLENRTKD